MTILHPQTKAHRSRDGLSHFPHPHQAGEVFNQPSNLPHPHRQPLPNHRPRHPINPNIVLRRPRRVGKAQPVQVDAVAVLRVVRHGFAVHGVHGGAQLVDGAGAAVLGEVPDGYGLLGSDLGTDGTEAEVLQIPAGGSRLPASAETVAKGLHYTAMDGQRVFIFALRTLGASVKRSVEAAGLDVARRTPAFHRDRTRSRFPRRPAR